MGITVDIISIWAFLEEKSLQSIQIPSQCGMVDSLRLENLQLRSGVPIVDKLILREN
jgi:hypothetical protein